MRDKRNFEYLEPVLILVAHLNLSNSLGLVGLILWVVWTIGDRWGLLGLVAGFSTTQNQIIFKNNL